LGTISKALNKYRGQRQSETDERKPDGSAGPERPPMREAGAPVSVGAALSDAGTETDGSDPAPLVDLGETLRRRARPATGTDAHLPAGPDAGAPPHFPPALKPLPPQESPQMPSEAALPAEPAAENRASEIPPTYEGFDAKLVVVTQPYSFEAEQFKLLRSSLLFPGNVRAPRSILVTSTEPGEGKTLVSANLAISIALNLDRHVLLVDCDLRRPYLHKLFGFGDHPGLSEYLSGCCSIESLLLKTPLDRFSFLTAGKIPVNPAELLNSDKMFGLMNEVRDRYADRVVIIDSPPPMLASESNALARVVDGVLLVIKYRSTKREDVAELVEKIGKDKFLGTVMNFTEKQALGYYRAKKYGYKYYHQAEKQLK